MARTISKKVFDDDLMLSDDFDESVLDKIEKRFQVPGEQQTEGSFPALDDETSGSTTQYSLDDFESGPTSETSPSSGGASEHRDPTASNTSASTSKWSFTPKIPRLKLVLIAAACTVVALGAGIIVAIMLYTSQPAHETVTMIKRAIPMPFRMEEHELLIQADSEKGKSLATVGLEIKFYGAEEPGLQAEKEIALRDAVYRFLSEGHPPQNTITYWEKIVSEDMQVYLNKTYPKMGLHSIRLTRFVRL